jgi:hypothetical protein
MGLNTGEDITVGSSALMKRREEREEEEEEKRRGKKNVEIQKVSTFCLFSFLSN